MRMTGVQTGGVSGTVRIIKLEKDGLVDAGTLLWCLCVTLPMIKATKIDQAFNNLILNHLIAQNVKKGRAIVVPD